MDIIAKSNPDGKTESIYIDGRVYISKAKSGKWNFFSVITKEWPNHDLKPINEIGKHASEKAAINWRGTSSEGSVISKREIFEVKR